MVNEIRQRVALNLETLGGPIHLVLNGPEYEFPSLQGGNFRIIVSVIGQLQHAWQAITGLRTLSLNFRHEN